MIDQPLSVWLQLKNIPIEPRTAIPVLRVFMGLRKWQVMTMRAGRVIALLNHVKAQVDRCNEIWKNIHGVLLEISDGLDRSHWSYLGDINLIYELSQGDILRSDAIEKKITFAKAVNWKKIELAKIRDDQNRYMKEKQKAKKT